MLFHGRLVGDAATGDRDDGVIDHGMRGGGECGFGPSGATGVRGSINNDAPIAPSFAGGGKPRCGEMTESVRRDEQTKGERREERAHQFAFYFVNLGVEARVHSPPLVIDGGTRLLHLCHAHRVPKLVLGRIQCQRVEVRYVQASTEMRRRDQNELGVLDQRGIDAEQRLLQIVDRGVRA